MGHLTRQELEAFVLGIPPRSEALRRHVAACPECARRLVEEARIESLLHEAMDDSIERPREPDHAQCPRSGAWRHHVRDSRAWLRRLAIAATLVFIAGAAWVLALRNSTGSRPPDALPMASVAEAPGFTDPMTALPGYDVVAPVDLCRHVTVPTESVPGL